jgi:pilus assembly protein CpaB
MKTGAIVVILALLAAGFTALIAKAWLDRQEPAATTPLATLDVMVVARNVAAGTPLQNDDLRYEPWPANLASPRLVTRQGKEDTRATYVGQIARRALSEGEPFSSEATARRENSGLMVAMLNPGMRAVSIAITNPTAVSGFITPGDPVDVIVASDLSRAIEGEHPAATEKLLRYSAETILTDIRVLAIDQQYTRTPDGGVVQGKTATLEVTSKQAEILTVAGLLGTMQLVLHGKSDARPPQDQTFSGDVEISAALRSLVSKRPVTKDGRPAPMPGVQVNRAGAISIEGMGR